MGKARYNILAANECKKAKKDKHGAWDIPRYSSGQEFLVIWRKSGKIELVKFCPIFRLKQEEKPPDRFSRSCKGRSLHFTVVKGPLKIGTLANIGFGGSCG